MILAQAGLKIFCSQGSIGLQWESRKMSKKGHNSATTSLTEKKENTAPLLFHGYSRPKPIGLLNFFEAGGINTQF